MNVQIIASSSSGNCYRLKSGSSQLLIEAGIPLSKIKKAINYELGYLDGVLISHEHGDHAAAARQLLANGVNVYMTHGTAKALGAGSNRLLVPGLPVYIGGTWAVMPFSVDHDAAEPVGFWSVMEEPGCFLPQTLFAYDINFGRTLS